MLVIVVYVLLDKIDREIYDGVMICQVKKLDFGVCDGYLEISQGVGIFFFFYNINV